MSQATNGAVADRDGWWGALEDEVLGCLDAGGASPADIARGLGLSEAAVCSVLAMLAAEGKVRISRVEIA